MPSEPSDFSDEPAAAEGLPERRSRRSRRKTAMFGLLALLILALAAGWFSRERIAGNLISSELAKRDIPASYRIASIGPREQVLENLVIGDPAQPDFTAERVIVSIQPRFGVPKIGSVRLVRPRLYGTFQKGRLSFGALDPLIFTGSKEPFRFPDMRLAIEDGRGLVETDHGAVGIALAGGGALRDGFAGKLAAVAPDLEYGGCELGRMTLFGKVTVTGERPRFDGPVRLSGLTCPDSDLRLAKADIAAKVTADVALNGAEGNLSLAAGALSLAENRIGGVSGTTHFTFRQGKLTARYDFAAKSLEAPQFKAPKVALAGRVRAAEEFSRIDVESEMSGSIAALGAPLADAMKALAASSEGTLVAQLLGKAGNALRQEAQGATFSASLTARRTPEGDSLVVPIGALRGRSGEALVSLSRLQLRKGQGGGVQIVAGNFSTSGPGLPRVSGQVRQSGEGYRLDLAMAEYASGDARLVLPKMVVQQRRGSLGFAGEMRVSGALPGGSADHMVLPIEGNWSETAGLSAWRNCTRVRFDRLRLASLDLAARSLSLCPPRGSAIARSGPGGLKIAAGVTSLDLEGKLGKTPIRIASGPVGLAWPGTLSARALNVSLGRPRSLSKFRAGQLTGRLGSDIAGTFGGADVLLDAVPLDLSELSGRWRFANGVLSLSQGAMTVTDREQVDRFEPLVARDATLRLENNVITARALLREPRSDGEVMRADIRHNLGTGNGHADLAVDALTFGNALQPDMISPLALGVIANAQGTVRGTGRIDWGGPEVTSSGSFSTDALDFAAAFGPVAGASGTVVFTDLLGLVTAPNQTFQIKSINPGIEVNDGVMAFTLLPGRILALTSAHWPFHDGTLQMRPVNIPIRSSDPVRYELIIEGIDAARFIQHIELGNLSATGRFDGQIPLVFDQDGGRIEGGYLQARPPGGNVSYVGELTYEDLSPMADFAFEALRSIDYREMRIELDGPLDGEMLTRVTFDGIRQGKGASSNFVTRRIAKLPIRFGVNVRAPFLQLVSSMRSLYDHEFIRDPRMLGIMDDEGVPRAPQRPAAPAERQTPLPPPARTPKPGVQPAESDRVQ